MFRILGILSGEVEKFEGPASLFRNKFGELVSSRVIYSAKQRAKNNSLDYDLSTEWGILKYTGRCELTGIPFYISDNGVMNPFSPSLDKIDPKKGYTKDNCRFILVAINSFKNNMLDVEMYKLIKLIHLNLVKTQEKNDVCT